MIGSAERRQVTALCADMVGSTAISEKLGEEGTFSLILPIYELMAAAVREQGGLVNDFTGDGIMALFGVPAALEDAPLRACRAALAIQNRLAKAAPAIERRHGVRPRMRIGISSGLAVVTQIRGNMTAVGDTVNMASRLQTLAEPGEVLLSEVTGRLVVGLVKAPFAGEYMIKGKSDPQKVYRLDDVIHDASRFDAAISRGLTAYVGRERELEMLERGLRASLDGVRVIDIMAEPGMGKSRLLHEFCRRVSNEQAFILRGNCSPIGQQTPFLPFIEVVRGAFQVDAGEAEIEITRKLELGLTALGLHSSLNLGLLLHLLGLTPPEGTLAGLDGVLIGLRTRDLLQQLLRVRCRLSPVMMLIEDLHWIDRASEGLLGKIIEDQTNLRLLIIHTRRPEYSPDWLAQQTVVQLHLEPLPAAAIRRLLITRLGVDMLPAALAEQVLQKAEGNALFAEEIASFLTERGVLRISSGKLQFDVEAVAAALPSSIQTLLTARVDRLRSEQSSLLQAASVIGRQFDPELLAAVMKTNIRDIEAQLAAIESHGLTYRAGHASDYIFKHALVRDALYQSLLSGPRRTLHLRIAEEIQRRSLNRLAEVAEALAYHYSQTDCTDQAFAYLAMAGAKSLGVYSLNEAETHFSSALALLDQDFNIANDQQVVEFLADYSSLLNMNLRFRDTVAVVGRHFDRLDKLGESSQMIIVLHHYVMAFIYMCRFQEARVAQHRLIRKVEGHTDARSIAYSLAGQITLSTVVSPLSIEEFEAAASKAALAASRTDDYYIHSWVRWVVAWEEIHRGRVAKARDVANECIRIWHDLDDPRPLLLRCGR